MKYTYPPRCFFLLLAAASVVIGHPLRADWTAQVPGPRSEQLDVTPASRFGAVATWTEADYEHGRLAWFSPSGELLLDYRVPTSEFRPDGEQIYPLNSRQLLLRGLLPGL